MLVITHHHCSDVFRFVCKHSGICGKQNVSLNELGGVGGGGVR